MNEQQPESRSNVPPLKELKVKVVDSDTYLRAVVLSENDERYLLRFSDGSEQSFSKEIVVPGNRVGNLEFVSVNASNLSNQRETVKTVASGELHLTTTNSNQELEHRINTQTSNANKLRNNKRLRQTEDKLETNIDKQRKHKLPQRKSAGIRREVYPKESSSSISDESSSSESLKSPKKKRADVSRKRTKRNRNVHKVSKNITKSQERNGSAERKAKSHEHTAQVTAVLTNYSHIPFTHKRGTQIEQSLEEQAINTQTIQGNEAIVESNREANFIQSPEIEMSIRNRSQNKYVYNRGSDNFPNFKYEKRESPRRVLMSNVSPNTLVRRSAINHNDETSLRIYREPESHGEKEDNDIITDVRQTYNFSSTGTQLASDKQLYYCPSKRFVTLSFLIILCVYFIEHKAKEQKSQILFFTPANNNMQDILGSVYISFFVVAIFSPSSELITSWCKSLALVYLFLLNYILLRIVVSQTQKWKEIALNIVIPCTMQMLYSILALYFQPSRNELSSGVVHRILILISPVVVSFPTIGSFHCQAFYEWFTIYSGCTIYCVGLIVWSLTKIEFRSIECAKGRTFILGNLVRLVLPRVANCRHPHYLGIKQRESGLGKSTLVNSMFCTDIYSDEYPGPSKRVAKTVKVETTKVRLKEKNVNLLLTIVDTPGFGGAVDNSNCWQPITDYIENRYEDYLNAETRLHRSSIQDNRVHCCLYFINPSGHSLKPIDIEFMSDEDAFQRLSA